MLVAENHVVFQTNIFKLLTWIIYWVYIKP